MDPKKMYPGPAKDDTHVYGPLQIPPDVDVHEEKPHNKAHEFKGKKHPEYGHHQKTGATYSPFDQPPKV